MALVGVEAPPTSSATMWTARMPRANRQLRLFAAEKLAPCFPWETSRYGWRVVLESSGLVTSNMLVTPLSRNETASVFPVLQSVILFPSTLYSSCRPHPSFVSLYRSGNNGRLLRSGGSLPFFSQKRRIRCSVKNTLLLVRSCGGMTSIQLNRSTALTVTTPTTTSKIPFFTEPSIYFPMERRFSELQR